MREIIDGIVYVPKEKKLELDLLEEKYKSGDYIGICKGVDGEWILSNVFVNGFYPKLIHKKHRNILDAWLADNSVEIEYHIERDLWAIDKNFIDKYEEDCEYRLKQQYSSLIESKDEPSIHLLRHLYHDLGTLKWIGADEGWDLAIEKVREYLSTELNNRLKPEQQYPIFKRNEDGEIYKLVDDINVECVLSSNLIGYKWFTHRLDFSNCETIPYDSERGFYHLQPVFFKGDTKISIGFYSVHDKHPLTEEGFHCLNHQTIEPITPEQLKVMPFVWDMYQQVLKDNK